MAFPNLKLSDWQNTRDTLQTFAQILGTVREALTPKQQHWMHVNLRPDVRGLSTPLIPGIDNSLKLHLDLISHELVVQASSGEIFSHSLKNQTSTAFCDLLLQDLAKLNINSQIELDNFSGEQILEYDPQKAGHYWQALRQIAEIFETFKGGLRGHATTINLWPHHFDLAFIWFSGRLVPGTDPNDEENADEQLSFGFSTGDEGIPDPSFYFLGYPWQKKTSQAELPQKAKWQSEGWNGGLLMYEELVSAKDGKKLLIDFMKACFEAGMPLMRNE